MTIAVIVPSIPPRASMLARALASVAAQTLVPDEICVAVDHDKRGAAHTRNRAWRMSTASWIAPLDDDDELMPHHLAVLMACAEATGADLVYPWFQMGPEGGTDPFPQHFGRPWDPANPVQTTITVLWRRTALEAVGGFPEPGDEYDPLGNRAGEDFEAVRRLNAMGGKIVHLPERTWTWHHHCSNTSGLPDRW